MRQSRFSGGDGCPTGWCRNGLRVPDPGLVSADAKRTGITRTCPHEVCSEPAGVLDRNDLCLACETFACSIQALRSAVVIMFIWPSMAHPPILLVGCKMDKITPVLQAALMLLTQGSMTSSFTHTPLSRSTAFAAGMPTAQGRWPWQIRSVL